MRKSTLFTFFMLTLLLGLKAKAQVAFVASSTPSNNEWATDIHWYYMTVDGKYVSLEATDDAGNLKLSVTEQPTNNEKAMWCLVGDNTNGYRFYNKSAGIAKVLGLTNIKHLDSDNTDSYGGSRAQMYDATTESSTTDDTGIGTNFIYTNGSATNSYYFKLYNTNMRYINQRGGYISYWASDQAVNNSGSTILFYKSDEQSNYNATLADANAVVARYKNRVGQVFSVPQSVIDTYESSLPSGDITDYAAAMTQVETALATFKTNVDEQWIRPTAGKIYIVQNAYNSRYMYASTTLGAQLNTLKSSSKIPQFTWTFEAGTTDGTYKMKNFATNTYVARPKEFITSTEATDLTITKSNLYDAAGAIGLTGGDYFMHSNVNTPVINGGDTWGASRWYIQEITDQEISTSIDNTYGIFPNIKDDAYNSAKSAFEADKTADNLNAWLSTAIKNVESKNYRIQNGRGAYSVLSFNSNGATILNESELKSAVNDLWRFKWDDANKFRLYNLNADKYLAAPVAFNTENTTALTDIAQSETYKVEEYTEANYFTITSTTNNYKINGEGDNKGCRVNNWSTVDEGKSNIWHILEANDIEVDMHAAGDGKTYATVYLPVSISGATNAQTYVAEAPNETTVTMNETTTGVKALNGFLLIGNESTTKATLTIGESDVTSNMTGTLTTLDLSTEDKSLYNVFGRKVEDGQTTTTVGFFTPSETLSSIGGNRGFFKGTKAQALTMDFGGQVTTIKHIDNAIDKSSIIYDLSGRRVKHITSGGLYITNGHKFIAK